MWTLAVTLALAASPAKVVAPTFSAAGIAEDKVRYFTSHFASKLRAHGVSVITAEEIGTLLGVERQKQLLGCVDGSSACLTELSNALGTDATARGTVAFIGGEYALTVTVLSNAGNVLAEFDTRGRDERGVLDALEEAADKLADALTAPRPGTEVHARRLRARSVVPFVLGVLVAGAGAVMLGESLSWYGQLSAQTMFLPGEGQAVAARGPTFYGLGWAGLGVGVAAIVLGVVLFALDGGST